MVGGEEVVGGELAEGAPADGVEDVVVQLTGEVVYHEELKVDGGAVAIAMADLRNPAADDGMDAEFLLELTGEGLLGGLAGLDLAAGKLPLEAHRLVWTALADENFGAAGLAGGLIGGGAQDQRRGHHAKRLAVCAAVSNQFANALFHAGV